MPWLEYLFNKNPLRQLFQHASTTPVARFARDRLNERLSSQFSTSSYKSPSAPTPTGPKHRDLLSHFLSNGPSLPPTGSSSPTQTQMAVVSR